LVLTLKLPVEPEAHSGITEGDTLTFRSEVETTAEVPAAPAGADNVKDPVTDDPPATEPLDRTTAFNVPPAAGFKLSVARPTTGGLATLVAVTVTVIFEGTSGGAVYLPEAEIVPAAGLTDHVTAEFASPANVGTNVRDSPADRVAAPGVIVIEGAGELVAPVFVIGATSAATPRSPSATNWLEASRYLA